jgi:FtsH-binding integral membrane protein
VTTVDGRRAIIGFVITAIVAFGANYLGDSTGTHAARGATLGVIAVVVGLSLSWWFSRVPEESESPHPK